MSSFINNELEKLLGILQPLKEVCKDEEKKFFRGEQSLHEVCIAIDCKVKPSAQNVAQYVSEILCSYVVVYTVHSLAVEPH